jgi:hypothetical protein
MKIRGIARRAAALAAGAIVALGITLAATAGPASALPRTCNQLEGDYTGAANQSEYWYNQGLSDYGYWDDAGFPSSSVYLDHFMQDVSSHQYWENLRVGYAQAIMDGC